MKRQRTFAIDPEQPAIKLLQFVGVEQQAKDRIDKPVFYRMPAPVHHLSVYNTT